MGVKLIMTKRKLVEADEDRKVNLQEPTSNDYDVDKILKGGDLDVRNQETEK